MLKLVGRGQPSLDINNVHHLSWIRQRLALQRLEVKQAGIQHVGGSDICHPAIDAVKPPGVLLFPVDQHFFDDLTLHIIL